MKSIVALSFIRCLLAAISGCSNPRAIAYKIAYRDDVTFESRWPRARSGGYQTGSIFYQQSR